MRGRYVLVIGSLIGIFLVAFLSAYFESTMGSFITNSQYPIYGMILFVFFTSILIGWIWQSSRSERSRSERINRAIAITRDAHAWALNLENEAISYIPIMRANSALFKYEHAKFLRETIPTLRSAINRFDELSKDIKELKTDVGNLFAPFDADFNFIQAEYQSTLTKLELVNNALDPIRYIVENSGQISIEDLLDIIDNDFGHLSL